MALKRKKAAAPVKKITVSVPKKILITSDDSEIEYVRTVPKTENKDEFHVYRYTKGLEKVGTETELTSEYIFKQLKFYFKEILCEENQI